MKPTDTIQYHKEAENGNGSDFGARHPGERKQVKG